MIRKYRVSTKTNKFDIDAESPLDCINNIYKGYDIQVEPSNELQYTHKIELLYTVKKSVKYYIVHVKGLNRKPKPSNYIEPMPKKELQRIVKEFKAIGGLIIMDKEAEDYLNRNNNEGSALDGYTIILPRRPSRSVVYEELIHTKQFRKGIIDGSLEKRLLCEIEAQEILIKNKNKWHITDIEDRQTHKALEYYKTQYKKLMEQGG